MPRTKLSVAITGMGCISGAGSTVEEIWRSLRDKTVNCGPVPAYLFSTALAYPVFAAPENILSPGALDLLDRVCPDFDKSSVSRTILLAVNAAAEALEQAGIAVEDLKGKRVGVAMGTTVGCTFHNEEYYVAWRDGLEPDLAPVRYYLAGNIATALHRILGTRGPSVVITNACASGTDAIGVARDWLAAGQCDVALAGGADELSRVAYNGFVSLMLSDTKACRPFNSDRQGLNLGEGAGVLVLETGDDARRRGAEPLGWVRGYGCAADAHHPTAPHPEGRGLKSALRQALDDAGEAVDLSYINAHGTGTKSNDIAETTALCAVFSEIRDKLIVVSTKGITGHTLGAAGGIEAVFTLMALRKAESPGTVGCLALDPEFPLEPLPQEKTANLHSRWGLSESLAFGGGNAVLILEARI